MRPFSWYSRRSIAVGLRPSLAIADGVASVDRLGLAPALIDAAVLNDAISRGLARRRPIFRAEDARSQRPDVEANRAIDVMNVRGAVVNRRVHRSLRRTSRHECGYRGGGRAARHFLNKHGVAFRKLLIRDEFAGLLQTSLTANCSEPP